MTAGFPSVVTDVDLRRRHLTPNRPVAPTTAHGRVAGDGQATFLA
jgi:hypothetical protein